MAPISIQNAHQFIRGYSQIYKSVIRYISTHYATIVTFVFGSFSQISAIRIEGYGKIFNGL